LIVCEEAIKYGQTVGMNEVFGDPVKPSISLYSKTKNDDLVL